MIAVVKSADLGTLWCVDRRSRRVLTSDDHLAFGSSWDVRCRIARKMVDGWEHRRWCSSSSMCFDEPWRRRLHSVVDVGDGRVWYDDDDDGGNRYSGSTGWRSWWCCWVRTVRDVLDHLYVSALCVLAGGFVDRFDLLVCKIKRMIWVS